MNKENAVEIPGIDSKGADFTNSRMAKSNSVPGYSRRCRFTGRQETFSNALSADTWSLAQVEPGVVGVLRNTDEFIDRIQPVAVLRSFEFKLVFDGRLPAQWQTVGRSFRAGSERMRLLA